MTTFFKELFEYNHHSNQKLINKLLENSDKTSEKSLHLQNHIINAHQIWNSRILTEIPFGVFEIHPTNELQELDNKNFQRTLEILKTKDLLEIINYKNTKGQTFSNSVKDILFHIINHSTYHRAQIATECKQQGIEPLITDYIFYKRAEQK